MIILPVSEVGIEIYKRESFENSVFSGVSDWARKRVFTGEKRENFPARFWGKEMTLMFSVLKFASVLVFTALGFKGNKSYICNSKP